MKFKITILLVGLLLIVSSGCSDSSSSKREDPAKTFDIVGYYEGELGVKQINQNNPEEVVIYEPKRETIHLTAVGGNEYRVSIANFEWQEEQPRSIEFNCLINDLNSEEETGSITAFISKANNEVIPNTEMNLVGSINGGFITMDANFEAQEGAEYNYQVSFQGDKSSQSYNSFLFTFESWYRYKSAYSTYSFEIPDMEHGIAWNTTDYLVAIWRDLRLVDKFTVYPHTKSYNGKNSALIQTIAVPDAASYPNTPYIYSGWLFTGGYLEGSRDRSAALPGVSFKQEPLSIGGYYSYKPGGAYYECLDLANPSQVVLNEDKKDAMAVWMFLYEANDEVDSLTLDELFNSDRVVGKAFYSTEEVSESFKRFDAKFNFYDGKVYDTSKEYKLAVVLSSSLEGIHYSGAIGSQLRVDNIEITTKTNN